MPLPSWKVNAFKPTVSTAWLPPMQGVNTSSDPPPISKTKLIERRVHLSPFPVVPPVLPLFEQLNAFLELVNRRLINAAPGASD